MRLSREIKLARMRNELQKLIEREPDADARMVLARAADALAQALRALECCS